MLTEHWSNDPKARKLAQNTVADAATRSFGGERMRLLVQFFDNFNDGYVRVLGVRDFDYRGTLEREVWLVDTTKVDPHTGQYDPDTAFVILHVHTAELWRNCKDQGIPNRDWSRVTQINIRNTSGTVPFVERNPQIGRANGWSGNSRVFTHQRWPERGRWSVPILRCNGSHKGSQEPNGLWRDWTGSVWQLDKDTNRWHDPVTGQPYDGPLGWEDRPCPPEVEGSSMKQEPWQWRRGRVGIDAQVDYEGLLEATFRGSLEAAFRDSWKQHVQDTIIRLLEMVDGVVAKGLMFRSVEQPSKAVWFPPPTQKPVPLKVLGCCVGVNKYKSDQLSNLQNCVCLMLKP